MAASRSCTRSALRLGGGGITLSCTRSALSRSRGRAGRRAVEVSGAAGLGTVGWVFKQHTPFATSRASMAPELEGVGSARGPESLQRAGDAFGSCDDYYVGPTGSV